MWPFRRKSEDRPAQAARKLQDILHNLELMAKTENAIGDYYRHCAERLPEEGAFWLELAGCERRHADQIGRMVELIASEPEQFAPGQTFNPASIRLLTQHVHALTDRQRLAAASREGLLAIALDLEQSVVELHYGQIVSSRNREFSLLAEEIDAESAVHREQIAGKLAEIRGGEG